MPKITKIHDSLNRDTFPYQRRTDRKNGSFRIRCACHTDCGRAIVICPGEPGRINDTVEIEGVVGSVDQWRQTFGPLLSMMPRPEFPLFGVKDKVTGKVKYLSEHETAYLWKNGVVELTSELMDSDFSVRKMPIDEFAWLNVTADYLDE